jgi:hypothetical protein
MTSHGYHRMYTTATARSSAALFLSLLADFSTYSSTQGGCGSPASQQPPPSRPRQGAPRHSHTPVEPLHQHAQRIPRWGYQGGDVCWGTCGVMQEWYGVVRRMGSVNVHQRRRFAPRGRWRSIATAERQPHGVQSSCCCDDTNTEKGCKQVIRHSLWFNTTVDIIAIAQWAAKPHLSIEAELRFKVEQLGESHDGGCERARVVTAQVSNLHGRLIAVLERRSACTVPETRTCIEGRSVQTDRQTYVILDHYGCRVVRFILVAALNLRHLIRCVSLAYMPLCPQHSPAHPSSHATAILAYCHWQPSL